MTVLDASALLALMHDEPGADVVASEVTGSFVGAANLAEVIGKLVDAGVDTTDLVGVLSAVGVTIEPVTEGDAVLAGALRGIPGGQNLSLGDRCCLALALRLDKPRCLTADRAWASLKLPLEVVLIR